MLQSIVMVCHLLAGVLNKFTVHIFRRTAALSPVEYKFGPHRLDEFIRYACRVHNFDSIGARLPLLIELSRRLDFKCRVCLFSSPGRQYVSSKSSI